MVQSKNRRLVTESALELFIDTQAASPVATLAELPAANSGNRGLIRFVTSENEPYYSNGTTWSSISQGAQGVPGPAGAGVPSGGEPLQIIRKNSVGTTTEWATPSKSMVGLSNVDNTADVDKPISAATQIALDEKVSATSLTNGLSGKADLSDGKVPISQLPTDALVTDANAAAVVDGVNKNLIENPASLTAGALSAAIDERTDIIPGQVAEQVPPLVAQAIAADEAPAQAAAAAVESAIQGRQLVEGSYRDAEGILVAIADSTGRTTWLAANDRDGGPTEWAARLIAQSLPADNLTSEFLDEVALRSLDSAGIGPLTVPGVLASITDANGRRTWLEANDADGGPTPESLAMLRRHLGDTAGPGFSATDKWVHPSGDLVPVLTDMTRIYCWGSSSAKGAATAYAAMASELGATYFDGGQSSEQASHISARIGSRPALLTVSGGSIPASGPVAVTASNVPFASYMKAFDGTLAGIAGTVAWDAGLSSATFTRANPGISTPVAAGTAFIPTAGSAARDAVNLLWMGKNGISDTENVIAQTNAAHDWMAPFVKRVLVLGHFVNTGSTSNAEHVVNAAYAARYGSHYIDVQGYVTGADVWLHTGITPTAGDLAQQAAGQKPSSLSNDSQHLNWATQIAIRDHLIKPRLLALGWY